MAEAAPVVRRWRGMVAVALRWLESETAFSDAQLMALADVVRAAVALDRGEDYPGRRSGQFWSAYYSTADGSGQHFVTTLPEGYDPGRLYPLVVSLRGSGGRPRPNPEAMHKAPYVSVAPWGRGDTSYAGLGEVDVLRVIEYAKQWYGIDPSRIYLTGASMGGGGTWRLATCHPDVFAAAAPVCGYPYTLLLENLRHVPVFNQHGVKDGVVPIDCGRRAVGLLQEMGYVVAHKEFPEAGHAIPGRYPVADWMLSFRRPDTPYVVTYTCQTPDRGRSYWLNIRRFEDPHCVAEVTARVACSGQVQMLSVLTSNVSVLELDVQRMPIEPGRGLLVQVGQTFLEQEGPLGRRLFLVAEGDGWRVIDQWCPPKADIRPYRSGAAANLYTGEPLMIVYGTQGGPARAAVLQRAAERLALFGGAGVQMVLGRFPVKADGDLTREDIVRYNLVLLGGPEDNDCVARIMDRLPIVVTDQNELVAGDREPVSLDGAGLRMLYYNPLSPHRLVFVLATAEPVEGMERWLEDPRTLMTGSGGWDWQDEPDLVVGTIGGPDRRRMQLAHGWAWRKVAGTDLRLPEAMAPDRAITEARLRTMRRAADADFAFWEGPSDKEGFDWRWFTLADLVPSRRRWPTIIARMSGQSLLQVRHKWASEGVLATYPEYSEEDIDPRRVYRVVFDPGLGWELGGDAHVRNMDPGPDWREEDLWAEALGR